MTDSAYVLLWTALGLQSVAVYRERSIEAARLEAQLHPHVLCVRT